MAGDRREESINLSLLLDVLGEHRKGCSTGGEVVRKALKTRWHECPCGCSMPRDIASGLVLRNRFEKCCRADSAENAPGEVLAGVSFGASSQDSVNGESPALQLALAG